MKVRTAPSITRVHTLHRVKSVVNYVNDLQKTNVKIIDDIRVAKHLMVTRLSKPTKRKERDQICRRARDHLETARYLGLLYRQKITGRKFTHKVTSWAEPLLTDTYDEECPANPREEAVLIDRLLRFKLTNVSYASTASTYKDLRIRPCLLILSALNSEELLNIFQIAYLLSYKKLDPYLSKERINSVLRKVIEPLFEKSYLSKLSKEDVKNIRRDTLPFVDWLCQVDLCRKVESGTIKITDRGKRVCNTYSKLFPLWWESLGYSHEVIAATVVLSNYFKATKKSKLIDSLVSLAVTHDLFHVNIKKAIRRSSLLEAVVDPNVMFDFSLNYDVPVDKWHEVRNIITDALERLDMLPLKVHELCRVNDFYTIDYIEKSAEKEASEASDRYSKSLNAAISIPATAILDQFRSPFEATTYVFLKQLESTVLRISKYQAQLSELLLDKKWSKLANSNPDIIATNNCCTLIECKSSEEWGNYFSLDKRTLGEIHLYNDYAHAVEKVGFRNSCKVLFSYEGEIRPGDKDDVDLLLKSDYPRVYFVLRKFLQKSLQNKQLRDRLKSLFEFPDAENGTHILG